MGLFSTKKKTKVYTSVSRMVDDADIKTSAQSAVVEFVLKSSTQTDTQIDSMSLTDHIRQAHLNSIASKMDSLYRYAKSGQYHYGLPSASVAYPTSNALDYEVRRHVETLEGTAVTLLYAHIGSPNYCHFAIKQLIDDYGYNPATKVMLRSTVESIVLHYSEATYAQVHDSTYFDQWESDAPPYVVGGSRDYALVSLLNGETVELTFDKYIASSHEGDSVMGDTDGSVDTTINEDDYVMGCYEFTQDGATVRSYFTYVFGSGTYPALDNIYDTDAGTGQYYPRVYARLDNTDLSDNKFKDTEAYKSSVRAGKKIDLTWNEWVGQIHDNIEDTSHLQQVFMCMALPANSKDQRVHQYMFKYFSRMYASSTQPAQGGENHGIAKEYAQFAVKAGASIVIQDAVFKQVLSYSVIGTRDCIGVVGEVGSYSMERGTAYALSVSRPYHAYRKQVTPNTYREVRVYNLSLSEEVGGGKSTVSATDSENLLVPVDRVLAGEFSSKDKEYLYSAGMHLVLNTLQVIKTKWYQTGIFKVVLFIAAVVLSVWTGGQSLTLYTIAIAAAESVLIGLALTVLAKIAVKLGVNVAIVAVVAVIVMAFAGYMNLNNLEKVGGLTAKNLMVISNEALNFTQNIATEELKIIAQKTEDFQASATEKDASLKELKDSLWSTPALADESWFRDTGTVKPKYPNLYQTPNDYYTASIHTGNPGVVCYDIVSTYVDQSLTLPRGVQSIPSIQGK